MNAFESMLRDSTIKAIDAVGHKFAGAEAKAENAITRLLDRWNALSVQEKENVAGVVIATAVTAVSAIAALRGGGRKGSVKRVMKSVGRSVTKKRL